MNKEDKNVRMLVRQKRDTEKSTKRKLTEEEHKEQIKKWTTCYRRNLELYCEDRLQIKLRPFQRILIHMMGISNVWFGICSRAISKTFCTSLVAVAICLTRPYSEVVITATTLSQGQKMVDEKIKTELIGKLSPVLKYMYDNGMIVIKSAKDECEVRFFNGSYIKVLPPLDSSRGEQIYGSLKIASLQSNL